MLSPSDVELDPNGLVQPDIFVDGFISGRPSQRWNSGAALVLVVEVLSPSTARADRTTKRRRYQRAGIPDYWIVDVDARVVERWRPQDDRPEMIATTLTWQPQPSGAPLAIELPLLFSRIHGETR